MKKREKDFCRWMAVYGEPEKAARTAGFKRPAEVWPRLLCREDIASEIRADVKLLRAVYEDTAICGLYRLSFGKTGDAMRLLYHEDPSDEELSELDLSSIAEIKRTKDKSVEIKFFDRIKSLDKLHETLRSSEEANSSGGLIEAMRLSAQALSRISQSEGDADEV